MDHNVMMIEYNEHYGDLTVAMVALFDGRDLTEDEAKKMIESEAYEHTGKMVVMSKTQYERVFRSLKQDEKTCNAKNAPACPFCGGNQIQLVQYQHPAGARWKIRCAGCLAEIDPGWAQDPNTVLNMWRQRAGAACIHAKWVDFSSKANMGKRCTHCNARITNREFVAGTHLFCHKCGAVMDNAREVQDQLELIRNNCGTV